MAYTLSNKCDKNLCKRTVLLQLIIENVVTFFWNTVYNRSKQLSLAWPSYILMTTVIGSTELKTARAVIV